MKVRCCKISFFLRCVNFNFFGIGGNFILLVNEYVGILFWWIVKRYVLYIYFLLFMFFKFVK